MTPRERAREFWTTKIRYPYGDKIKARRLYEINYLVPRLQTDRTILDLGCGDGSLIRCLDKLLVVDQWFAYDISARLIIELYEIATTAVVDLYKEIDLPTTDATIMAGVFPFIFEDEVVDRILANIQSPNLFVRVPCTIHDTRVQVNEFSEDLGEEYAAVYRTVPEMWGLLDKHFTITSIDRVYPDKIESLEFSTRQFYFRCHGK